MVSAQTFGIMSENFQSTFNKIQHKGSHWATQLLIYNFG
jgi:hypothetical protein